MGVNNTKKYIVYMHISPHSKRYIGITCKSKVEYRWVNGNGYKDNEHFYRAINKYGWENFQHIIVAKDLTKENACKMEQDLIKQYNTCDENFGYNNTYGGETNIPSEHTLQKMRGKFGALNPMYGRKMPESAKERLREVNLGRKMSEETKQKISRANKGKNTWLKGKPISMEKRKNISEKLKGRTFSEKHRKNLSIKAKETHQGRQVLQFTKDGVLIQSWQNAKIAGATLKIPDDNIYRAIKTKTKKGRNYTAGGYVWKYADMYTPSV